MIVTHLWWGLFRCAAACSAVFQAVGCGLWEVRPEPEKGRKERKMAVLRSVCFLDLLNQTFQQTIRYPQLLLV